MLSYQQIDSDPLRNEHGNAFTHEFASKLQGGLPTLFSPYKKFLSAFHSAVFKRALEAHSLAEEDRGEVYSHMQLNQCEIAFHILQRFDEYLHTENLSAANAGTSELYTLLERNCKHRESANVAVSLEAQKMLDLLTNMKDAPADTQKDKKRRRESDEDAGPESKHVHLGR